MNSDTNRILVMGDIHGAHKALVQCLRRADFDYERDVLIQLGDIADGTDEVFECVEELLKIKHLIAIKGNHDVWFADFLTTGKHPRSWAYGGEATLASYQRHVQPQGIYYPKGEGFETSLSNESIPQSHKTFFLNQKLYYVDQQKRLFVHAGYNADADFYGQPAENYYFDRSLWLDNLSAQDGKGIAKFYGKESPFSEIYIGHTATTRWDIDQPMRAFHITNLDTGARHNGRLTLMDIETKAYWQSSPIPELYGEEVLRR